MKEEEAYSILDIISESDGQSVILTRSGSICIPFELRQPECYSLSPEEIDERDGMYREAFRHMPDGTYVHKQDVFLKKEYHPGKGTGSFLDRADARHFEGRLYIDHTCILHFVLAGLKSLEKAYVSSPLAYKEHLHREDYRKLEAFLEGVDNAVSILQNMRGNSVLPMSCKGYPDSPAHTPACSVIRTPWWIYTSTGACMWERTMRAAMRCATRPSFRKETSSPMSGTSRCHRPLHNCTIP